MSADEAAVEAVGSFIRRYLATGYKGERSVIARAVLATPVVDGWRRDAALLAKVRAIVDGDDGWQEPHDLLNAIADLLASES